MIMAVILTDTGLVRETIIKFDEDITENQVETLNYMFNNKLKGEPITKIDKPLEKYLVEEIKALGETFDPELHEAVSSVQDDTKGEKEIVQEYRKGYKIGHRVIRHSMVVVAN